MPANVLVLYPAEAAQDFDMDYYLSTHMPLVGERFGKHGLKTWRITLPKLPNGDAGPYYLQADLVFDNMDQVQAALKNEGGAVLGDIPNFTKTEALIMPGEQVAFGEGKN